MENTVLRLTIHKLRQINYVARSNSPAVAALDEESINRCSDKIAFKARLRLTKSTDPAGANGSHQILYT